MDQMPVFVKINEPKEIRDLMDSLRNKIDETKGTLDKIQSLSEEQSVKVEAWLSNFDDMNAKIDDIKDMLLEPEAD